MLTMQTFLTLQGGCWIPGQSVLHFDSLVLLYLIWLINLTSNLLTNGWIFIGGVSSLQHCHRIIGWGGVGGDSGGLAVLV